MSSVNIIHVLNWVDGEKVTLCKQYVCMCDIFFQNNKQMYTMP